MTGSLLLTKGDGTDLAGSGTTREYLYPHTDGTWWYKGSDGVEHSLSGLQSLTSGDNSIVVTIAGTSATVRFANPWLGLVTAASKTYSTADRGGFYQRINGGAAMSDVLPALTAADDGFTLGVQNSGTTPAETITFTTAAPQAGAIFGNSGTSYTLQYGCRQTFIWTGTQWLFGAGDARLTKAPTTAPAANDLAVFADATGRQLASGGQITSYRLDQFSAPTASVSFGNQRATNGATPTNPTDFATKSYVDGVAQGLANKDQAVAVATANVALTGLPTVDTVTLTDGQQILLTGQTTASQNGEWLVHTGAWTRPTTFATGSDATGTYVFIESGFQYGSSGWTISGAGPIVVDTTAQVWTQFTGAGEITTDATITKAGNQLSRSAITGDVSIPAGNNVAAIIAQAVSNAKLALMPATTVKGNNTGATGAPLDLTMLQLSQILPLAGPTAQGLVSALQYQVIQAFQGAVEIIVTANPYSNLAFDGSTDDLAALNALYAAAPDHSVLIFPTGTMLTSGAGTIPAGKHFAHRGAGSNKTFWLCTNGTSDHVTLGDWQSTFDGITFTTLALTVAGAQTVTGAAQTLNVSGVPANFPTSGVLSLPTSTPTGSGASWVNFTMTSRTGTTITGTAASAGSGQTGQPFGGAAVAATAYFKSGGYAINAASNVDVFVNNCSFVGCYNDTLMNGTICSIINSQSSNAINYDWQFNGANVNSIMHNVTSDGSPPAKARVEVNQCGSLLISDCDLIRGIHNLDLNASNTGAGVFGVYCVNTYFDTPVGGSSVYFQGNGNIQRVKFTQCWMSSAGGGTFHGIEFASTAAALPTAIEIDNCDIYANTGSGVMANGVADFAVRNCKIAGNTADGITVNPSAGGVTRYYVNGNIIGPTGGFGGNGGYGLRVNTGTYARAAYHDNDLTGNTLGAVLDNGTYTAQKVNNDNLGAVLAPPANTAAFGPITNTNTYVQPGCPIPANSLQPGSIIRLTLNLTFTSTAASTVTMASKFGTAGTVADATLVTNGTTTTAVNASAKVQVELHVRSVGAAGTCWVTQTSWTNASAGFQNTPALVASGSASINTTVANFFGFTFLTGATTNAVTVQTIFYEIVRQ